VPELPEVETIRLELAPLIEGRRIEDVRIHDSRLTRPEEPELIAAALTGDRVVALRRRGKYVLFELESGRHLLVHLRMTGSFRHERNGTLEDDPYRRAVVSLDDGSDVTYRDVRRFGTWELLEPDELQLYLDARLGPEPLDADFTAASLARSLEGRRTPIKGVLLSQRAAAGIGNIYADEALWRARMHPMRPAGGLTRPEIASLHRAIRTVLRAGIEAQGATLRDYRGPAGTAGSMQERFEVYGRDGEPCSRCGSQIAKTRVAGRGTWFCPRCQCPPPDQA
jgi:formamidopyrimidine-DNA glycosylase